MRRFGSIRCLALLTVGLLVAPGCRCGTRLTVEPPPSLSVSPASLALTATYVGQSVAGAVSVSNGGGRTEALSVSIDAPFTVEVPEVKLGRGAEEAIVVRFTPLSAGRASGTLRIGPLEVPVEAEALEVPACVPSAVCVDSRFDVATAQCVEANSECSPRPKRSATARVGVRGQLSAVSSKGSGMRSPASAAASATLR